MAGSAFQVGVFPNGYSSGYAGGPLVFFDTSLNSLVLSPLSLFLSTITNLNTDVLEVGVQGKVKSIPVGYSFDYILSLGSSPGVSNALMSWGDVLLTQYVSFIFSILFFLLFQPRGCSFFLFYVFLLIVIIIGMERLAFLPQSALLFSTWDTPPLVFISTILWMEMNRIIFSLLLFLIIILNINYYD